MDNQEKGIRKIQLTSEMKTSFMNYAMSVIVARALPDVRDGMKPVQRRIVYGMNELGCYSDKAYKKSARIVGEVMGKYHPHGDSSIYEALVRMAQDFSYRYMLVDGHGNFGSIDGDGAAAMRYTEARMSKISMELMRDINKDTIDFIPNYDGEEREPSVLPCRIPNLLVNGTTGIAVGMATNMPPHNIGEVIDAVIAVSKNPDITVLELMENYIQGPDFPTGGYILGKSAIKKAYETGNGLIVMRAKTEIEEHKGRQRIVAYEIPYQVNKARLVEKIAHLARDKVVEGISDVRDESNREGIRIVIELKRDVQAEVILNQLYKLTSLQTTFGVNNIALVNNEPKTLTLKELIQYYLQHQEEVIRRRTQFELNKAEARAHILEGLKKALDHIDEIIQLIRTSRTTEIIQQRLMDEFGMSDKQAKAVREMQLQRLAGLEREKIEEELNNLLITIADLKDILANEERILEIIRNELLEMKEKYGDKRRTEIIQGTFDIEDEDLIPVEDVIISLTNNGYVKRMPVDTYKSQNRGGRGVKGMSTTQDDVISSLIHMSTHDDLLIFTNKGKVYRLKGYNIPEFGRTAKGLPIVNILNLDKDESVKSLININKKMIEEDKHWYLFFATEQGLVKRVDISEFENIRQTGKIAIKLNEDDALGGVKVNSDYDFTTLHGNYHIVKGEQDMDGDKALCFVRERHAFLAGDFVRGQNQQKLLKAMLSKAMSPKIITNFETILSAIEGCFETNMTSDEMKSLINMQLDDNADWEIFNVQVSGEGYQTDQTYSMPGSTIYVMKPYQSYVRKIKKLIDRVENGDKLTDKDVKGLGNDSNTDTDAE